MNKRVSIMLNEREIEYLDAAVKLGIYGRTRAEAVRRILDARLEELLNSGAGYLAEQALESRKKGQRK